MMGVESFASRTLYYFQVEVSKVVPQITLLLLPFPASPLFPLLRPLGVPLPQLSSAPVSDSGTADVPSCYLLHVH